jgi:plasmid stabilization system protein ParE
MAQLSWSLRAVMNLEDRCGYIAQTSEQNARAFADGVRDAVSLLTRHPRLGARVPEYDREDIREMLVQKHRVIYRLVADDVVIVSVVHGAQRLPRTPPG